MELKCNPSLADRLTRNTQRARVISEAWFATEGYCLNCDSERLKATTAGTIARDFECRVCGQPYELKSAAKAHTRIVQDGGFDSMMRRIRAQEAPALMLMHYSPAWSVQRLVAVHPVFLTQVVVRKRAKPHIRPGTKQEYWMCDLDLQGFLPMERLLSWTTRRCGRRLKFERRFVTRCVLRKFRWRSEDGQGWCLPQCGRLAKWSSRSKMSISMRRRCTRPIRRILMFARRFGNSCRCCAIWDMWSFWSAVCIECCSKA